MGKISLKFLFPPPFSIFKITSLWPTKEMRVGQRPRPVSSAWKAHFLTAHVMDLTIVSTVTMFPSNENNSCCVFLFLLF